MRRHRDAEDDIRTSDTDTSETTSGRPGDAGNGGRDARATNTPGDNSGRRDDGRRMRCMNATALGADVTRIRHS